MPFPMDVDSTTRAPPPNPWVTNTDYSWTPGGSPVDDHGIARLHQRAAYDDDSVSALSFGFLATGILVSMFLIMAVFERFLRPAEHHRDIEGGKPICFASPKMKVYDSGVSVMMPGDEVPSFIAHHAPLSRPPERHLHPTHQRASQSEHPT